MNGKDPLMLSTPDNTRILFDRMSRAADGFSVENVVGAAANLLINSVRQSTAARKQAEVNFDELAAKMKAVLMDHYDGHGRKKGIFPYPQEIRLDLFHSKLRS